MSTDSDRSPAADRAREEAETMLYRTGAKHLHLPRSLLGGPADESFCYHPTDKMRPVDPASVPPTWATVCPDCLERLAILRRRPADVPPTARVIGPHSTRHGNPEMTCPAAMQDWLEDPDAIGFWVDAGRFHAAPWGEIPAEIAKRAPNKSHIEERKAIRREPQGGRGRDTSVPSVLAVELGLAMHDYVAWWSSADRRATGAIIQRGEQ